MGMGEPLANHDRVWPAVERIHADLGLSARHLTLSTVGLVPGIDRLARADLPVNLAVSLHAANDALRDELVPVNRRYPLGALMAACSRYLEAKGRRLSFEWALIDGVNDRLDDAEELADLGRSPPARPPRQPDPAQPDARLADEGHVGGRRAALPRPPRRPRGERHDPPQPGHGHRRRVRPAGRRAGRDGGPGPGRGYSTW